jgi:iron complex outermembrane recepter protein
LLTRSKFTKSNKGDSMMSIKTQDSARLRYMVASVLALANSMAMAADNDNVEEVVVTGSRLVNRGFDAPTPVTTVGAEEFTLSGTQNIETLLNDTPQFAGSQNNNQSGNTVQAGQPIGTATLNLRGLGQQRNLVLVNGRRFALAGPDFTTDINTIPTALVERTEIVTGGSSAVYGSDAVAGVVNFIMKSNFEGVAVALNHSTDQHTNSPSTNATLTLGGNFADNKGNMVVSIDYLKRTGFTRGERGDWAGMNLKDGCVTAASWSETSAGTPFSPPTGQTCVSSGNRPGLVFDGSATIPTGRVSGVSNAALAAGGFPAIGGGNGFFFSDDAQSISAYTDANGYDLGPLAYLVTPQDRWMGNVFGHLELNDKMTTYVELHASKTSADVQIAPTNYGGNILINTNNPYVSAGMRQTLTAIDAAETAPATFTPGSPYFTQVNSPNDGIAMINLSRRFSDIGGRIASAEHTVFRTAVGLRGELGDVSDSAFKNLAYDVYFSYASTSEADFQGNSISKAAFQRAVLRPSAAANPVLNPFGANMTPAGAAAITINSNASIKAERQMAAASLSGVAFELPMGPVDFALGTEWRDDKGSYSPDAFLSSGDVSGWNAANATSGSTSVKEVFTEWRVPLLSNMAAAKSLSLNTAYRYSDYDIAAVDGVSTYSFGAEWTIIDGLSLRAQRQRAIRAPNVGELFGGRGTDGPNATDPCSSRAAAANQTPAVAAVCVATGVPSAQVFTVGVQPNSFLNRVVGGNPALKPETSNTTTVGVVYNTPDLSISLDYFNIEVDGAISQLGGGGIQGVLDLCYLTLQNPNSVYCQAVHRDPTNGQITAPDYVSTTNANIGGIETSGYDLEARYALNAFSSSRFEFSGSLTYTREFTTTPDQERPHLFNECIGAWGGTCGQPLPKLKGGLRASWMLGDWTASLKLRYIGGVTIDSYLLPTRQGVANVAGLETRTNPEIDAQTYVDLTGGYTFGDGNYSLTAGVRNLLDKDPPVLGSSNLGGSNTIPATYDVLGRVFFVGATAKF